ncbi:MAG: hypothetical protein KDE31_10665 [Caldilineaceae bacterium]|nr:hypothetical protein [Caldilineaceae bacterium]
MAKRSFTKKSQMLRARRKRSRQRNLEQPESQGVSQWRGLAASQPGFSTRTPMLSRISPDLIASLGRVQGNHHVLGVLPTVQREKEISTPVDKKIKPNKDGSVTMDVNGTSVMIRPDGRTGNKAMTGKAETSIHIAHYKFPNALTQKGKVVAFKGNITITHNFTIRTIYGPKVTAQSKSAYGRGTTKEDIAAGHTSLGFHEGNHGLDFIAYLKNNPLPKFEGMVGMSVKEYKAAMAAYSAAMNSYMIAIDNASEQKTDCVGEKAHFCITKSTE